ncbi:MAG: helix-turn-helix domain-containing protein [Smithellaceae bacterium]|nr:helix-turn-helix domain-containing protein [Smithellaceae bacterium]MDD3258873.1 helix-turn-helix domain-containing protein [Smithellaceae bacterium]MDD3848995.1 helix-turn-helix domain-containing protein [Smithellaceae bacterium]
MRKSFAELNYYEMLDVSPTAAAFEIRQAYGTALQIYRTGSAASHSFFTEAERREILSLVEKAYRTLADELTRKAYDDELASRGEIDRPAQAGPDAKKPVGIFNISRVRDRQPVPANQESLKSKIRESERISELTARSSLSGAGLKEIREELGVAIAQIAQATKVRQDHLVNIEEDRVERLPAAIFLKGFVKSYLKYLCLEPVEELSARYMETIARLPRREGAQEQE